MESLSGYVPSISIFLNLPHTSKEDQRQRGIGLDWELGVNPDLYNYIIINHVLQLLYAMFYIIVYHPSLNSLLFCFCHLKKEIMEKVEHTFFEGWRVSTDHAKPARRSGCLDCVTLPPKVAFKRPCIQTTVYQPTVLCNPLFLIPLVCYHMIPDTIMAFSVALEMF